MGQVAATVTPIKILDREFIPDAGGHEPPNGKAKACIMEMAAYMAGEPWSDHPDCSSPVIGAFCRVFWDRNPRAWPGLVERLPRIAGSADPSLEKAVAG